VEEFVLVDVVEGADDGTVPDATGEFVDEIGDVELVAPEDFGLLLEVTLGDPPSEFASATNRLF